MTDRPEATSLPGDDALLDSATTEQIERANNAVFANLDEWGVPKYESAFGYSCALTAIIQTDEAIANRLSARPSGPDGELVATLRRVARYTDLPLADCNRRALLEAASRLEALTAPPSEAQIEAAWQAHRKLYNYEDDEPLPKRAELYAAIYLAMQESAK